MQDTLVKDNYYQRAHALCEVERFREAIPLLTKASTVNPHDYDALCLLSHCFQKLNEFDKAIEYADKAISVNPEKEHGYRVRGLAFYKSRNFAKYLGAARIGIACEPENPLAVENLVYALVYNNQLDEARIFADKLLELEPNSSDSHYASGLVNLYLQRGEAAERDLRRSLEIDPSRADARHNLSFAVNLKAKALKSDPGQILEDEELAHFEAAFKQDPNNQLYIYNLKTQFTTLPLYYNFFFISPLILFGLYVTPIVTLLFSLFLGYSIGMQTIRVRRRRKKLSPELQNFLKARNGSQFFREHLTNFLHLMHEMYRKIWPPIVIAALIFLTCFFELQLSINTYVYFALKFLFWLNAVWLICRLGELNREKPRKIFV